MGLLIDSTVLIEFERGRLDLDRHIRTEGEEEVFLSVITASELLHGLHRANAPARRAKRAAFVEAALRRFPILLIDLEIARVHAQLWAELGARGLMIGTHDSWLAATCLAHDLTLATANVREFARVPGLRVERWSGTK